MSQTDNKIKLTYINNEQLEKTASPNLVTETPNDRGPVVVLHASEVSFNPETKGATNIQYALTQGRTKGIK